MGGPWTSGTTTSQMSPCSSSGGVEHHLRVSPAGLVYTHRQRLHHPSRLLESSSLAWQEPHTLLRLGWESLPFSSDDLK